MPGDVDAAEILCIYNMMVVFRWNTWNVEHIARRGVQPEEAEYVALHARAPYPEKRPDGKFRVWGRTRSGRYLQVVYVYDEDDDADRNGVAAIEDLDLVDLIHVAEGALVVYVLHARELEASEKSQYLKRLRRRRSDE